MIRNLKVLGLALTAVFAFAAIAASGASAQGTLTTEGGASVTLTGVETGAVGANQWTMFGIGTTCVSIYKGHKYNVTPHTGVPSGSTTATINTHNTSCHVPGTTFLATVDMNGCDYVLHIGATTNASLDEYAVTWDLVCPEAKDVTATIFWDATDHANNKPFCVFHIKPQTGLKGAEIRDTTNGHLDLTGAVEGIHIVGTDTTAHALFCPVAGDEQTITTGKWDFDVTISGDGSGLKLSHP